jgi:hypothetical protein
MTPPRRRAVIGPLAARGTRLWDWRNRGGRNGQVTQARSPLKLRPSPNDGAGSRPEGATSIGADATERARPRRSCIPNRCGGSCHLRASEQVTAACPSRQARPPTQESACWLRRGASGVCQHSALNRRIVSSRRVARPDACARAMYREVHAAVPGVRNQTSTLGGAGLAGSPAGSKARGVRALLATLRLPSRPNENVRAAVARTFVLGRRTTTHVPAGPRLKRCLKTCGNHVGCVQHV